MKASSRHSAGDWVEVRSKEEILKTLDAKGQLDSLPFMPEMFNHCGRRFRVFKRAHKTCDTVNKTGGRKMLNTVHLDRVRCDGKAHGGCQAGCLVFWKDDWLKSVPEPSSPVAISPSQELREVDGQASGCREEDVWAATNVRTTENAAGPIYVCQATQVPAATELLPWWNTRQYIEDLASGNVALGQMACGFIYMGYRGLINSGIGLGRPLRWFYDRFQRLRGGVPYPRKRGRIPAGKRTPSGELNLQSGEWVRVKSYEEILATLDANNRNRGLYFDAEMVPYCGRSFRVLTRVNKILDEKTGKMTEFKKPCIILEGVACESRYSECRLFCPRRIYSYWREIWLERVSPPENRLRFVKGSDIRREQFTN